MTAGVRFRYRDESGTEHELASVEALSESIEKGRLSPDTSLFDAGTGQWGRAGDMPVFQFVVDELRREGRLPDRFDAAAPPRSTPPGQKGAADAPATSPPPRTDTGSAERPDESPAAEKSAESPAAEKRAESPPADKLAADPAAEERGEEPPADKRAEDPAAEKRSEHPAAGGAGTEAQVDEGAAEQFEVGPGGGEFEEEELELEDEGTPIAPDLEELPLTPDPFEMHLPRTRMGPTETDPGSDADEADEEEDDSDDEVDSSSLHEWMLSQKKGVTGSRDEEEDSDDASPSEYSLPPDDDRPPRRLKGIEPLASEGTSVEAAPDPWGAEESAGPDLDPSDWDTGALQEEETESREIRSRPPPPRRDGRSRRRSRLRDRRRGMLVGLVAGGGVVLLIAILILTPGGSDSADLVQGPGSAASGTPSPSMDLPPFPLPDGSPGWDEELGAPPEGDEAVPALALQGLMTRELETLMDSVRIEMGLEVIPPSGWLGGQYLSGASRFTEVSGFWEDYSAFVERLAAEDQALYREAAVRAWEAAEGEGVETPAGPGAFLEAIDQRYTLVGEARQVRYERRLAVARAAGELHAFLVEREGEIEYAPALGGGVSADPVLEAVPMNSQVRRELELHLDRLFQALDQTRLGGVPSLGGLRSELFNQLREPV